MGQSTTHTSTRLSSALLNRLVTSPAKLTVVMLLSQLLSFSSSKNSPHGTIHCFWPSHGNDYKLLSSPVQQNMIFDLLINSFSLEYNMGNKTEANWEWERLNKRCPSSFIFASALVSHMVLQEIHFTSESKRIFFFTDWQCFQSTLCNVI